MNLFFTFARVSQVEPPPSGEQAVVVGVLVALAEGSAVALTELITVAALALLLLEGGATVTTLFVGFFEVGQATADAFKSVM